MSQPELTGDLPDRITRVNDRPFNQAGQYVLAVLHRALRVEENPVLDVAVSYARSHALPLLVYTDLNEAGPYQNDRLAYFTLGAFRELAQRLSALNVPCIQTIRKRDSDDPLEPWIKKAAVVCVDEDFTVWDRQWLARVSNLTSQCLIAVDAARLVPTRKLADNLGSTPAFRKANGALRDHYAEQRKAVSPFAEIAQALQQSDGLPTDQNFAACSDDDLRGAIASLNIDHTIPISTEHLPTMDAVRSRLQTLQTQILSRYKWIRNNPALEYSTSELSPYMHYGMLGPHQLLDAVLSADMPKSYSWKFRDEFITWREWSHYQAFYIPKLHEFSALPKKAKQTLIDHADDPRPEQCDFDDILHGRTPDPTWNAAQREWLHTGWLHNNLRMYWAKQILRFTPNPQEAWKVACQLNDALSLDGRDPATYASMQWSFGNAKPGYSEKPIYGWVASKSDRAILKRKGMADWIATRQPNADIQMNLDIS